MIIMFCIFSLLPVCLTLLLRKHLLLPLKARDPLDDRVEEGHLKKTHTRNIKDFISRRHIVMIEPFKSDISKQCFSAQVCVTACVWAGVSVHI